MTLPLTILRPTAADLPLDRGEVLRLLGYRPGVTRLEARHEALVDQGIARTLEAAAPVVSLTYCGVTVDGDQVSTLLPGLAWRSRSLARCLQGALGISLVAATLGAGVDDLIARLFASEEYALATVVDAAGSALIHGLSQYVQVLLEAPALTPLYGPGYGDWPMEDLPALTRAAGGDAIGLAATETGYLEPQKSLVGLVGWLPVAGRSRGTGCSLCTMKDCAYRVVVTYV